MSASVKVLGQIDDHFDAGEHQSLKYELAVSTCIYTARGS